MHLVHRGVWIATHVVPTEQARFLAVVEGTTLRKDASQADFVMDGSYREIMKASVKAMESALSSPSARQRLEEKDTFSSRKSWTRRS